MATVARIRVGNGTASYAYAFTTTRSFPTRAKQLLAVTMTSSVLEAYEAYDSVGRDDTTDAAEALSVHARPGRVPCR